jgi:hypothetical protein
MQIDLNILGTTQAITYLLRMTAPQQPAKIRRKVAAEIAVELEALSLTAGPDHPSYAQIQALQAWSGGEWPLAASERARDVLRSLLTPESTFISNNDSVCLTPSAAWRLYELLPAELREKLKTAPSA